MITHYVLGFAFNKDHTTVALIKKNRPKSQEGLLNGIGGHIEDSDIIPAHAMVREFKEETGYDTNVDDWQRFATINGINWTVDVFRSDTVRLNELDSLTDEEVQVWDVKMLLSEGIDKIMSNLIYLIPLAQDATVGHAKITYV